MVPMFWCRPCNAWTEAEGHTVCPSCDLPWTQPKPTLFSEYAYIVQTQEQHTDAWHHARRKLGGRGRCECGVFA